MAKRIKIKGKAPRGLSKAQRMVKNLSSDPEWKTWVEGVDPKNVLSHRPEFKRGVTAPSSTRKKLVKEGNRKFIGPRSLKSEDGEHEAAEARSFGLGGPDPNRNYGKGNTRGGRFKEISEPDFDSIGSERLKEMLMNILYKRGLAMPF